MFQHNCIYTLFQSLSTLEKATHLFFHCSFADKLWKWLATTLNRQLYLNSFDEVWHMTDGGRSPQCKIVIHVSLVNIIHII